MRAADMILKLAEDAAKKKPADMKEIGTRDNDLDVGSDGILSESDEITLETYRKMRQDPQVKACLLVLKLPLIQVDWSITADTDEGKQIAAWVESRMTDMDDSLQYYLREIMTAMDFGRSITEKVWALREVPVDPDDPNSRMEQMIVPQKLKTYDPKSLKIKLDDKMRLESVVQSTKGADITIPADNLLIYTHEKEFGDYYGQSVLRSSYKPWIIKEFLQKFWNIALERYGTPFSTMTLPQGGSLKTAMALMDQIKHKTGIPLPDGYAMEVHNLANAGMSFKEAIEYQDKMIARGMLIPDLVFGNSDSGAYALSKTHAAFFLLRLNGIYQEVGDVLTKYLIKPLVQYNYGDVKEFPKFQFSDVAEEEKTELINLITQMLAGKVIAPTESWIRERLNIPPADEESQEYLDKQREVVMSGLENIQKANAAKGSGGSPAAGDQGGGQGPEVDVNATPEDKAAAAKKKAAGIQKNAEEAQDFQLDDRVQVKGKPHMKGQSTGVIALVRKTNVYAIQFDGMDMIHKWYIQDEIDNESGEGAPEVGDTIKVTGTPHMPGAKTGTVKQVINTFVYGIIFDGMEDMGIHKWYIQAELEADDTEDMSEGGSKKKKKKKDMSGMAMAELDDYMANLRASVRGILKVGINGEE